jgi:hypothetical protein
MEYDFTVPGHTFVFPPGDVIEPGIPGGLTMVSVAVLAIPVPQLLTALTDNVPPVVPAVTVMVFVVEVPLHPEGSVQR